MSPVQISKNDPRLAHAMSRALYDCLVTGAVRHRDKVRDAVNVKQFMTAVNKHFADCLLQMVVVRPVGSRALAYAHILDAVVGGGMCVVQIAFDAKLPGQRKVWTNPERVTISNHAIARACQRTIGSASIAEVRNALSEHLAQAVMTARRLADEAAAPCKVMVAGAGGALLGDYDDGLLALKTWVGEDAADPAIRRLAAQSEITVFCDGD